MLNKFPSYSLESGQISWTGTFEDLSECRNSLWESYIGDMTRSH